MATETTVQTMMTGSALDKMADELAALRAENAALRAACEAIVRLAFRNPNRKRPHEDDDYVIASSLLEHVRAAIGGGG